MKGAPEPGPAGAPGPEGAPGATGVEGVEAPAAAGALPDPETLAGHYARFRVDERILLTGHSHQAWPDVAFHAQLQAWEDAARWVDGKWGPAYEAADRVREGWRHLLGDDASGEIALGPNTHELVVRFLSALPLERRRTLLTTEAEFHTIRRQVDRLDEAGWVRVRKVPGRPVEDAAARLVTAVESDPDGIAAVLVSTVFFATAEVVPGIPELARVCRRHGIPLLLDTYHHLNALPFSVTENGLQDVWITGGGYKYCQLGEGNCFLRFPADTEARPVFTGWFSEFAELAEPKTPGEVPYGKGPARFMGATYDPVSHYRADAVFRFFGEQDLTPERLRAVSRRQTGRLAAALEGELGREAFPGLRRGPDGMGGFLAVELPGDGGRPGAEAAHAALREAGILTDYRGDMLRLGPAPYVTDAQLDAAAEALLETLRRS